MATWVKQTIASAAEVSLSPPARRGRVPVATNVSFPDAKRVAPALVVL